MPAAGERFSSASMADCEFCPRDGRRFRTTRQCSSCGRFLCIVCRPQVPQIAVLCPDCGGGARDDALHQPEAAIQRISEAGYTVPFWLIVIQERLAKLPSKDPEELIVPE
jgi:hypothetical protein